MNVLQKLKHVSHVKVRARKAREKWGQVRHVKKWGHVSHV